jgi:hypothetical protein
LDCSMAECFLALLSSFSNDFARSTVSPYPWSKSVFCQDLSTTSCSRQHPLLRYSALVGNQLLNGYCHVPSSIAQPGALTASCAPLLPG